MPQLASIKSCTGCMSCLETCKHKAIEVKIYNNFRYPQINKQKCIECGQCTKKCPIINPISRNIFSDIQAYYGWCTDEDIRFKSASGGAFSAIAKSFFKISNKPIVIGAQLTNNKVKHVLIEKENDIELLMNSKYLQSNTIGIYEETKQKLKEGYEVLFSGTPCQIAGLYSFLKKSEQLINNLYTIDLVCHGVTSEEALNLHLTYNQGKKIISFRDKIESQKIHKTTIVSNNVLKRVSPQNDLFYPIFSSWLLGRKSCSNCKYSSIPRIADITIGDYWSDSKSEYYKKGISLIVGNNSKGIKLINDSLFLYKQNVTIQEAINTNPNLYTGFKCIQWHPIVMWPYFFKRILPAKIRLDILTNKMPYKLFWAVFKVPTIYLTKLKKKEVLKQLSTNEQTKKNYINKTTI